VTMEYEELFVGLHRYKNLTDGATFVEMLENETKSEWSSLQWSNSTIADGIVSEYRSSLRCSLVPLFPPFTNYNASPLGFMFRRHVYEPVILAVEHYQQVNMLDPCIHEEFELLKYQGGGRYNAHYDHHSMNSRIFSVVSFLGNTSQGEGQLEFPRLGITVEAEPNTTVIFPANFPYIHIAHPVHTGVKYSMVTWYRSSPI